MKELHLYIVWRKKQHNNPLLRWLVGFAYMSLAKYIHVWAQEVTFNIAYEFNGIPSVERLCTLKRIAHISIAINLSLYRIFELDFFFYFS